MEATGSIVPMTKWAAEGLQDWHFGVNVNSPEILLEVLNVIFGGESLFFSLYDL